MSTLDDYRVIAKKVTLSDGTPGVAFDEDILLGAGTVCNKITFRDEATGSMLSYGIMPAYFNTEEGERGVYHADEPWYWPALEESTLPPMC